MYSWGGSTAGWKDPGKYKFDSARAPYLDQLAAQSAAQGPRQYDMNKVPNMDLVDPRGKTVRSESTTPLAIVLDETGSQDVLPGHFCDRAPLFYQTLSQYKPELEVLYAAIGDAYSDRYPLQVNHFGKGVELEDHIKAIGCEGNGGGQRHETYELFAYFMANHCEIPNAVSPFMLIYGDELFYETVNPDQVRALIGDSIEPMRSEDVWRHLLLDWNIFYISKRYQRGEFPEFDREKNDRWRQVLGPERVIELPTDPEEPDNLEYGFERAVDVGLGLVALSWGEYGDFMQNLAARQPDPAVQQSVHHTLRVLSATPTGKSIVRAPTAMRTKPLALPEH